jgi:hypothetical protein
MYMVSIDVQAHPRFASAYVMDSDVMDMVQRDALRAAVAAARARDTGLRQHQGGAVGPVQPPAPVAQRVVTWETFIEGGEHILQRLRALLLEVNPFARELRHAGDVLREELSLWAQRGSPPDRIPDVRIEFSVGQAADGDHSGVLNAPVASEVAFIVPDENIMWLESTWRQFVTYVIANGRSKVIKETHPSFCSLRFPLLFPYGTNGWAPWRLRTRLRPPEPEHVPTPDNSDHDGEGVRPRQLGAYVGRQRPVLEDSDDDSDVVVGVI